jgi:uncharacterized protein
VQRFHLEKEIKEFTRCMECNSLLERIEKEKVFNTLPKKVQEWHNEFVQCSGCGKVYWKGSHYEKMRKIIDEFLK